MQEERLTPIGSSGAAPDVALQPGTQPIQFHSPPRLTAELRFSGPVTHRHGQHTWHTHDEQEYRNHQQPIDDEELTADGGQCPEMSDVVIDRTVYMGARCALMAGHPGEDPRIHKILGTQSWHSWTDDELLCTAYRTLRRLGHRVRQVTVTSSNDDEGPYLGEPTGKPQLERAYFDGARIWVENGGKLHLAGWRDGIPVIDPFDNTDHRAKMLELLPPIQPDGDVTPEQVAKLLHHSYNRYAESKGLQAEGDSVSWDDVSVDERELTTAVAAELIQVLMAQFTKQAGDAIAAARSDVSALRERYELKLVAIDFAARGDWEQIAELVGHPDHPYWTPTLQTIADATERAAAALADRPDNFFVDHSFHLVGDDEGNDEYWVCQTCEVVDFDKGAIKAPWPCAGALAAQPDLARLNAALPVGTTVTFRPNGVGDATVTTTRTPVWIAKDGHSYVSVNAYPPQSGAAVRTDSLCIDRASA